LRYLKSGDPDIMKKEAEKEALEVGMGQTLLEEGVINYFFAD